MDAGKWPYKPNTIQIETVQGCNRRCKFCGTMGMEKRVHYAETGTVIHTCNLIRQAGLNCRILLAGHGEPTLHPEIERIIRIIRTALPNSMIHLFTNGTVTERQPEKVIGLFNAGLNDLVFDEYRDHRVGKFVRADPICRRYPILEQGPGVPLFAGKKTGTRRICIVPPIDAEGNTASRKLNNHCGAGMPALKEPLKAKCSIIFRDFFIRWDGNIAICCNDFRGEYYVTNILECRTLREAYFHKRLEAARRFLMASDRAPVYPCNICTTKPIRPGLLPDATGKTALPKPTEQDYVTVRNRREPLARIERREWEAHCD